MTHERKTNGDRLPGTTRGYRFRADFAVADAGIETWGHTLEDIFTAAAEATIEVMANERRPQEPLRTETIELASDSLDLLLVRFLDEIIYRKDAERCFAEVASLVITGDDGFQLAAKLQLKPLDGAAYDFRVDVKAVTLHRLSVERTGDVWRATFVLDV